MKKKIISIIWWYHKQIFDFDKKQNYHMLPFEVMKDEWYNLEIYAINSKVKIEKDPNFIKWINIIYHKNIFNYLYYLFKNRNNIIFSNSLTIKTLLVWLIWKKTIFYPHTNPFWKQSKFWNIKKLITKFFYLFYNKVKINNKEEEKLINKIKSNLVIRIPLSISDNFYFKDLENRKKEIIWLWNIYPIKNPLFLIDLMKKLNEKNIDIKLKIIWEDRYKEHANKSFKQIIKENKLEKYIEILWYKPHNEVKKILSKSMIFLNTSIDEWQCLAVYEWALAWNSLCLPNIIAFPSVFEKNALYHNNIDELISNIVYYLNNEDKRKSMISENQKMILKEYDYEYIKSKVKNMFLNLEKKERKN